MKRQSGQVIVRVSLFRVEWTGFWEEINGAAVERVNRVHVRDLYFSAPTRDKAERAWLRSDACRDRGMLDWEFAD